MTYPATVSSFSRIHFSHRPKTIVTLLAAATLLTLASGRDATAQGIPGYVVLPLASVRNTNQATVRVTLNGQKTMLLLDTGASTTLLDSSFYQGAKSKITIKKEDLPPQLQHVNANGERAEIGYIDSLTAGSMDFGKSPVVVTDLSRGLGAYNTFHAHGAVSGLLGEDFLHKYAAIIDWRRRGVYFNTDPSRRMKLGPGLLAAGWTAVPMAPTDARHFAVACTVSGKPVRLIVDTGAQFTTFTPGLVPLTVIYNRDTGPSMDRLAATTSIMSMIGLDSSMHPARVEHWKIGSYEIASANVAVNKLPPGLLTQKSAGEGPILGLLGAEQLAMNNAIVDVAGATLYLKPK